MARRLEEHSQKTEKGAKYTHSHTVLKIEAAWKSENRKLASQLEYQIKKLEKSQKEALVHNNALFSKLFAEKFNEEDFERIK